MDITRTMRRSGILGACLLSLGALPPQSLPDGLLAGVAWAQDDEDEEGGAVMDAGLQWKLIDATWNRREYDDAAALMRAFAEANPDHINALEGLWRTYEIYRAHRPNPDKRKGAYERATAAVEREMQKYRTSDKERAAHAAWYSVWLAANEVGRPAAIIKLQAMIKISPGTSWDDDALWHLAEWLREAGRFRESIPIFQAYGKVVGNSPAGANAAYREAWMYQELKENANAIKAFKAAVDGPFNWGWGEMHWAALDAARRVKAMGDEATMRAFGVKILEKTSKDWLDYQNQVRTLLGEKAVIVPGLKRILIYPHLHFNYTTDKVNIDGRTKISVVRDVPVLVRMQNVTKEDPFKATITLVPKVAMAQESPDMKKADGGKSFTADINVPDAKEQIQGDWWYRFTTAELSDVAPDNLTVTRKWTKQGNGWGECTIRIQSSARWHVWVYLPNNKTSPNNLTFQPNEVQEGGKTFKWHDHFDMNKGITIKFPVEVGGAVEEFFPKIRLERGSWHRNPDRAGEGKEATYDFAEFSLKLKSEQSFPYAVSFPGNTVVTMDEVSK